MMKMLYDQLEKFKPKFSSDLYKSVLLTLPAVAIIVPLVVVAIPPLEFFNDMARQPKGKAQMLHGGYFGEGNVSERLPVEGTIPRGYFERYYPLAGLTRQEVRDQNLKFYENPVVATEEALYAGKKHFQDYCTPCHGKLGQGDGLVTALKREAGFPPPPTFHSKAGREVEDGEIYHVITTGQNLMSSYANKLSPQERWNVVHYVRALQRAFDPKPEDLK